MTFPEVEIHPDESVFKADEKVEKAFEAAGLTLTAFDGLNSFLDIASYCHFYQVALGERVGVVVVITQPWEEKTLRQVVNVLLETYLDPDPPGSRVAFHFYSAYEIPPFLRSIFGDSSCCQFECRAFLTLVDRRCVEEVSPEVCTQLAAAGTALLRECFRVDASLFTTNGEEVLDRTLQERFFVDRDCVEPACALTVLGCLYGEVVRAQAGLPSRWSAASGDGPWPELELEPQNGDGTPLRFDPIGRVFHAFENRRHGLLTSCAQQLYRDCAVRGANPLARDV